MFRFKDYARYAGQHSFLSASNYHWLNYDDQKLTERYLALMAASRGTELHALAAQLIKLREKLPRSAKTLNMYVNDAIGFRMTPEQTLFYSPNAFGTADSISFRDDILRIHDYKS
jgi:lipid A disaccharide synthetase